MPLHRSVLYVPASNHRALAKIPQLPCDSVIIDLEDAVDPARKAAARNSLPVAISAAKSNGCYKIIRINALCTPWGAEDAGAVSRVDCDGVLLPKAAHPAQVEELQKLCPGLPVWIMIETPKGVQNAAKLASMAGVAGLIAGTNDLASDLRLRGARPRRGLQLALQSMVLAARASGVAVVDGVFNATSDSEGLRAEAEEGRDFGFDGKSLIHPAQIEVVNSIFTPSAKELSHAQQVIEAFDMARADGQGVAVLNGEIIEALHAQRAKDLIADFADSPQ